MADEPNVEDPIRENAAGPTRAEDDPVVVEQHSLTDQIEADRCRSSKDAAKMPAKGLRFNKLVPPRGA